MHEPSSWHQNRVLTRLRAWLGWNPIGPTSPLFRDAIARLEGCEREIARLKMLEVAREAALADTIDRLTRVFKRLQQRAAGDEADEADPVTRLVLDRRRRQLKG